MTMSTDMTNPKPPVLERIREIHEQFLDGNRSPHEMRTDLIELTALFGQCQDELRAADYRAREAKDAARLVIELIRSCKAYLRNLEEEMRLTV